MVDEKKDFLSEKDRKFRVNRDFKDYGLYKTDEEAYSGTQKFGGAGGEESKIRGYDKAYGMREDDLEGYDSNRLNALSSQMKGNIKARGAQGLRDVASSQGRYGVSGATAGRQMSQVRGETNEQLNRADQNLLLMQGEKQDKALGEFEERSGKDLALIQASEREIEQTSLIKQAMAAKSFAATQAANAANGKGSCFITTACCELLGLPDDNNILNTFRKFRDEHLGGKEGVKDYYEKAPKILKSMSELNETDYLYLMISKYLIPCYRYIEDGDNHLAESLYIEMFNHLKERYL